jgi:hypothetical protein
MGRLSFLGEEDNEHCLELANAAKAIRCFGAEIGANSGINYHSWNMSETLENINNKNQ